MEVELFEVYYWKCYVAIEILNIGSKTIGNVKCYYWKLNSHLPSMGSDDPLPP